MSERVVTKSDARKYTVRKEGRWVASVLLDDDIGEIGIHSDWGDFWFAWFPGGRGTKTLREFIVGCDASYLCGKFLQSYRNVGCSNKTLDNIESRLLRFLGDDWPALKQQWKSELAIEKEMFGGVAS